MKKLSAIIIAIALVFGLSQCKKDKPVTPDAEDGMVYVTVNVANNGAKHEVYPSTGTYVFENGDKLYVGNNGHYVGYLQYVIQTSCYAAVCRVSNIGFCCITRKSIAISARRSE